ncbi:MAG: hypothetical protein U0401_24720 [Anaerolineae bacterium]
MAAAILDLPAVSLGLWYNFGGVDPFENCGWLAGPLIWGITHLAQPTTTRPFGSAEETFGQILKKDLAPYRDELVISTKPAISCGPAPT